MKKTAIGSVIVTVLAAASANAADYPPTPCCAPSPPVYAAPAPVAPPIYFCWCGAYVGANAGFQWTSNIGGPSPSGVTAGIQGGYNWQSGPWVYGFETDFNLSSASDRFSDIEFSNPAFGTLRGRAGYTISNFLLYTTGGFAWGIDTVARGGLSESSAHLGWTIGAGVEVGLASFGPAWSAWSAWSAKAEYLYLGLSQGVVLPASVPANFQSNVLRFGVNYHF